MDYKIISIIGHVNHGKTSLTKALTGVDTDKLKDEKDRKMSIRLGYAPLKFKNKCVSIIDVPGHEKFLGRMIAGVYDADCFIMVIALNEGIQKQTLDHLKIINLLGCNNGIVVLTKMDLVEDAENRLQNIKNDLRNTTLANSPIYMVNSVSQTGIEALKKGISSSLSNKDNESTGNHFHLPIDNTYNIKSIGTIITGTIKSGTVVKRDQLFLYPSKEIINIKQMQSFNKVITFGKAKQRVAINVSNPKNGKYEKGMVLSDSKFITVTTNISIKLLFNEPQIKLKNGLDVRIYAGTSEVIGRLKYIHEDFTYNNLIKMVYCQLLLSKPIVVKRKERVIIRTISPNNLIGGGVVLETDPLKIKNKLMLNYLKVIDNYSPIEYIMHLLNKSCFLTIEDIILKSELNEDNVKEVLQDLKKKQLLVNFYKNFWCSVNSLCEIKDNIINQLNDYHKKEPLMKGLSKATLLEELCFNYHKKQVEWAFQILIRDSKVSQDGTNIYLEGFSIKANINESEIINSIVSSISNDKLNIKPVEEYFIDSRLSDKKTKLIINLLVEQRKLIHLYNNYYITDIVFCDIKKIIYYNYPQGFLLKDVRKLVNSSRRKLVTLLELYDKHKFTKRVTEYRIWLSEIKI